MQSVGFRSVLNAFLVSLLVVHSTSPVCAGTSKTNGWTLSQHGKVSGNSKTEITETALKAYKLTAQDTVMCTPPKFLVTLANEKTKKYFVTPLDRWRAKLIGRLGDAISGTLSAPHRTSQKLRINGINTVLYVAEVTDPMPVPTSNQRKKYKRRVIKSMDFWLAEDIHVAPDVSTVLCYFHGLPRLPGIPIRVAHHYDDGEVYLFLETFSAKRTNIDVASFKPPTGYLRANSDSEVFIDKKTAALMEMFGDALHSDKK